MINCILEQYSVLKGLNLSNNGIIQNYFVDLYEIKNLERLSERKELESIDFSSNHLEKLDNFQFAKNLKKIKLNNNKM